MHPIVPASPSSSGSKRPLPRTLLAMIGLALATSIGCGGTPDVFEGGGDGSGNASGLAVGSACTSDSECGGGGTPRCLDGLYPLESLTDDPGLQSIGVPFPGGYCSAEPSCESDAECGEGGKCFQPLADVDDQTLDTIGATLPQIDVTAFATYGACLDPCVDNTECREGYVCAVPIGDLLSLVPGARLDTFCIGRTDSTGCGVCGPHATCDASASPPTCECAAGYVADGNACVAATGCDESSCANGGTCSVVDDAITCSCPMGFTGATCETAVVDGCASHPCVHGTCSAGDGAAYTCSCATGFTGPNCDAAVDCGALPTPTNGSVATPHGTTFGRVAAYACASGFELVGDATRACGEAGEWSGALPSCVAIDCGALPAPTHGSVVAPNGTTMARVATYACSSGFVLDRGANRTCQRDGTWSGTAPLCVDDPCAPNPCTNGGTCTASSDGASYVCACPAGRSGATCQNLLLACYPDPCNGHGTCSGTGTCACATGYAGSTCNVPAECGALSQPANGSVATNGTTYGSTATYSCAEGNALLGNTTRTCGADGTWSGSEPTCTPVDCGALMHPGSGVVATPNGTRYGASAEYACEIGTSPSGVTTRTCGPDGTWSGYAVTCDATSCAPLDTPANGTVTTSNGTSYGSTATFGCAPGYSLVGASTRTCGLDGTWSGESPTCALTSCTLTYRFSSPNANGAALRIQPSAGATTVDVGPGTMIVRVPRDANGRPAAGTAELLYFDLDEFFGPVSGVTTEARICLLEPGTQRPNVSVAATPPEQSQQPGCIAESNVRTMASGAFAVPSAGAGTLSFGCYDPYPTSANYTPAQAAGTAPGCMQTWFSYGRIRCASGQACAFAVSPQDTWIDKSASWSQHFLAPIALSSNFANLVMGNRNGGADVSAWAHVPNEDNGWTGFALVGTLDTAASTCVTAP